MAENTMDHGAAGQARGRPDTETRRRDNARIRRIGSWHASAVLVALTLFGAGSYLAADSSLVVLQLVALGNALVAGTVIASIVHEWGHFSGARASGAASPVLAKPRRFYFMFDFDMENNSVRQFQWMSLGGISANWLLVVLVAVSFPMDSLAAALLLATVFGRAVNVSFFEVPIVLRTRVSDEPERELKMQLETVGIRQAPGLVAGALAWLALA